MPSLQATAGALALACSVLVAGCTGVVPGSDVGSGEDDVNTVQDETVAAMQAVESYTTVTNMEVSVGDDRTFTNVRTIVNGSTDTVEIRRVGHNVTGYVVGDRHYRNESGQWESGPAGTGVLGDHPARTQVELLNASESTALGHPVVDGKERYHLSLSLGNDTLAGLLERQKENGIDDSSAVTIEDKSYELLVNMTTHRVRKVEMYVQFRYEGEVGRATLITWFDRYNRSVPGPIPEDLPAD